MCLELEVTFEQVVMPLLETWVMILALLLKTSLSAHTCAVSVRPALGGNGVSPPGGSSCTSKT